MKKVFKKSALVLSAVLMTVVMAFVLVGCTTVKVGGSFLLNEDGTGSRVIEASITKTDTGKNENDEAETISHKFFKVHGDELQTKLTAIYTAKMPTATWLTVTVDNTAADVEKIKLSFNFTSFADYQSKMTELAKLGAAEVPEGYIAPTFAADTADETLMIYKENSTVLGSITKSMMNAIFDDDTIFDITAGGSNVTSAAGVTPVTYRYSLSDLKSNSLEVGNISIKLGQNKVKTVSAKGNIELKVHMNGLPVPQVTNKIVEYNFNDNMANSGTKGAAFNLKKGEISTGGEYAAGIDGKGYKFDGTTYLEYADTTDSGYLALENATFSFYYKADKWNETDTGANLVFVNAGLDALSPGALDMGFSMDTKDERKPVKFLAKGNGSSWSVQDKMETETYFNNRVGEWHNYITVFSTELVDDEVNGYITLYIDGIKIAKMAQYNMAGAPLLLGNENGLNIGGYFEADIVKRGLAGTLDNLVIYDGALSETELKAIYNANPVEKPYDAEDDSNITLPVLSTNDDEKTAGCGCGSIAFVGGGSAGGITTALISILALASLIFVIKRKNKALLKAVK